MCLSLIIAATTFCNPMSIPDTPVGILCRDFRNGDAIPESGWMHSCWANAVSHFSEVRQFRELADPVVLAEGDTWHLYSSAGLMWTSEDFGGTWRHVPVQSEAAYAPGPYRYRVDYRSNGEWWTWLDASKNDVDLLVDYREAPEAVADAVRLVVLSAPPGITPGLVEFTVFGTPLQPAGRPADQGIGRP